MRRTNNSPVKKTVNELEGDVGLLVNCFPSRFAALRIVISIALFSGILLSWNLWFPTTRSFPRAPLIFAVPQGAISTVEYLLSGLLLAALVALVFARRPTKYLLALIILLILLISFDQMRLQPWVYQYLLIFGVLALHKRKSRNEEVNRFSLSILQLIIAMLYFWSGVQKLNYSFGHEVLPQLLVPLQNYLSLTQAQLSTLGIAIALVEIFTGCGLLLKKTRKLCMGLALAMHGILIVLLMGLGRNHVVWAWNAALMLTVIVLFWRSDTFIWQTFANWRATNAWRRVAVALAITYAALPIISFWGWWDMYLSGALYSGNTAVAVVRVDDRAYERLPETAKRHAFTTRSNEKMVPVFEWAMTELNVPPYPELRVFRQVTREICASAEEKSQVELILKGRPAILDGGYAVTRMNCSQLD